jgi:integrase
MKITAGFLRSLKPTGKRQVSNRENLEVRISAKGAIVISYKFKVGERIDRVGLHKMRHHTDQIPPGTTEQLNDTYQKVRSLHGMGHNPVLLAIQGDKKDSQQAQSLLNRPKLSQATAVYLEYFMAEKASWRTERRLLDIINAELGPKNPRSVRKQDLQRLVDKHRKETPTNARHIAKCLSRLWGWMSRRGWVDSRDAARDLDKPSQRIRTRMLSDAEIGVLLGPGVPKAILATAYNPLRRAEICRLSWDGVDVIGGDHWVSVRVKGGALFRTYLSPQFLDCVETTEGFMFLAVRGRRAGQPMLPNTLSGLMRDYAKRVGVPDVGVHDFRASYMSWAEGAGLSERVADGVPAHARQGIMRHYGHSDLAEVKRDALEKWARHLDGLRVKDYDEDGLPLVDRAPTAEEVRSIADKFYPPYEMA